MSSKKQCIANYYHHRFIEIYDIHGNDLSKQALENLKNVLTPEEFYYYKKLDVSTRSVYELFDKEDREITEKDSQLLDNYLIAADNPEIPADCRIAMYELIQDGCDKTQKGYLFYFSVLARKLELLRDPHKIESTLKQMILHSYRVSKDIILPLYALAYHNTRDKKNFPYMSEVMEYRNILKRKKKRQGQKDAEKQLFAMLKQAEEEERSADERIDILQDSLDVLKKTGLIRSRKLKGKAYINGRISNLYLQKDDEVAARFFAKEQEHYMYLYEKTRNYGLQARIKRQQQTR